MVPSKFVTVGEEEAMSTIFILIPVKIVRERRFKPHQPHYSQLLELSRFLLCILIEEENPAANTYFLERLQVHIDK